MKTFNPEKRAWRGRSYKKGGRRIRDLKDAAVKQEVKQEIK